MKSSVLALAVCVPMLAGYTLQDPKPQTVKSEIKKVADVACSVGSIYMPDHRNSGSLIIIKKEDWGNKTFHYSAITAHHVVAKTLEDKEKHGKISFREEFHGPLLDEDIVFFVDINLPAFDMSVISFYSKMDLDSVDIASKENFKAIKPFEKIYAIGCDQGRGPILRTGNIGATDMVMPKFLREMMKNNIRSNSPPWVHKPLMFFRPFISIWQGASGGGVFNSEGRLIGIINAMANSWQGPVTHQCIALNITELKFLIEEQLKDK